MNDIKLSTHFKLSEFLNTGKYPQNIPSMQDVVNMTFGWLHISWNPFGKPRHYVRIGYYK